MGQLVFQATLGGQVNLVGPNTASTFNINVPAVAGNMVTTGDTGTVTNTMLASSAYTAPGTIGSGTANTGAFTTLTASSTITGTKLIPTGTSVTGNGMYLPAANTLGFSTNGTNAVTIDASQNVGVGVTPSAWASNIKAVQLYAGALWNFSNNQNNLYLDQNSYYNGTNNIYVNSGAYASRYLQSGGTHSWYIAPSGTAGNAITFTQAMTLDASGNLLVGTTSLTGSVAGISVANSGANVQALTTNSTSSSSYYIGRFYSGGVEKGYIYYNGTIVTFTSTSDYRLKENVQPMTGALAKVAQLKPCTYTWKENGVDGQGFIAHELQAVVPDCVTGEKDAINEDGSIKPQGIDTSFLVATLTAAIQEQQALITQLQADVAALKGA